MFSTSPEEEEQSNEILVHTSLILAGYMQTPNAQIIIGNKRVRGDI